MTKFTARNENISDLTRILVKLNSDVFENQFADTVSDGATKEQARRLVASLLSSSLDILMEYGHGAIGGDSGKAYDLLADMGRDFYANGGDLRRDAGFLCEENYVKFALAARARAARSSGRPMTPVERAKASATGSRTTKPKAGSKSVKTRKPSKSVKTKTRSKASTASKSTKRKTAGRR